MESQGQNQVFDKDTFDTCDIFWNSFLDDLEKLSEILKNN